MTKDLWLGCCLETVTSKNFIRDSFFAITSSAQDWAANIEYLLVKFRVNQGSEVMSGYLMVVAERENKLYKKNWLHISVAWAAVIVAQWAHVLKLNSVDVNEVQPGKWALSIYSQLQNWIKMLPHFKCPIFQHTRKVTETADYLVFTKTSNRCSAIAI